MSLQLSSPVLTSPPLSPTSPTQSSPIAISAPASFSSPSSSRLSESPPPYSVISDEPDQYTYVRSNFTVTLGKRIWHTPVPVYGARAHVRGTVKLGESPYGQIIVVSLIGKLTVGYGKTAWTTEILRLVKSAEVYEDILDFDLRIPEFESSGVHRLPPSISRSQCNIRATVRYYLRVEFCGSWSIFERFEAPILYLPRIQVPVPPVLTRALPFPRPRLPSFDDESLSEEESKVPEMVSSQDPNGWTHIRAPHSPPPPYTTLFERLQAWIHHPAAELVDKVEESPLEMLIHQPAEFATGQQIPFVVRARADIDPHAINVSLIARLMVRMHGKWIAREVPTGSTEIWGVAPDPSPAHRVGESTPHVMWGIVVPDAEDVSWSVPLQASLSFGLRVTAPPAWTANAPLSLRTHSWDAVDIEQGRRAPAMALATFALQEVSSEIS